MTRRLTFARRLQYWVTVHCETTLTHSGGSKKKLNFTFKLVPRTKKKDEIAKWTLDMMTFLGSIDTKNIVVKKAQGSPRLVVSHNFQSAFNALVERC